MYVRLSVGMEYQAHHLFDVISAYLDIFQIYARPYVIHYEMNNAGIWQMAIVIA